MDQTSRELLARRLHHRTEITEKAIEELIADGNPIRVVLWNLFDRAYDLGQHEILRQGLVD